MPKNIAFAVISLKNERPEMIFKPMQIFSVYDSRIPNKETVSNMCFLFNCLLYNGSHFKSFRLFV